MTIIEEPAIIWFIYIYNTFDSKKEKKKKIYLQTQKSLLRLDFKKYK